MASTSPSPGHEEPLLALLGPTASGKSALALALAERLDAEIVSVDSMLVYRGMDIGTAKPTPLEQERIPHHVLDRVDPPERYDVQRWLGDARTALADIAGRGRRALLVGGTVFYLKALTHGVFQGPVHDPQLRAALEERARLEGPEAMHAELMTVDPTAAARIHPNDTRRVVRGLEVWEQTGETLTQLQQEWSAGEGRARRLVGIRRPRPVLAARIAERARAMLVAGWPEEARAVRDGPGFGPTSIQALGYREALALADGELDRSGAEEQISLATRQFARRQDTWLRKFPELAWIEVEEGGRDASAGALEEALALLDG